MGEIGPVDGRTEMASPLRSPSPRPMTKAHRMLVVLLLVLSVVAAGCGGDNGDSGTSGTTEWADGLCSAITTWTTSISSATSSLTGESLSEDGLKDAADEVESATETFVDDVKGLGAPDTDAGQQAKESLDELADSLNEEVDKIKSAADDASGVSGVLAAVSTITGTLSTIGEQLSSAFTELEQLDAGGELETALKEADSCQDIGGSG